MNPVATWVGIIIKNFSSIPSQRNHGIINAKLAALVEAIL